MGNRGGKPRRGRPPTPPHLCDPDPSGFDRVAESLQRSGVGCVRVDDDTARAMARCFGEARRAMPTVSSLPPGDPLAIPPDADSAHASGAHAVGWGSSYNAAREGFVFSDGASFGVPADDPEAAADFERAMGAAFRAALAAAREVLSALERRLALERGWFEKSFGPLDDHAQWHVKRYRPECVASNGVLLPVHTDPSLISVVAHDAPGVEKGARGLEYLDAYASGGGATEKKGAWAEVPYHGHGVLTVFTGSVLDRITGGAFPAARHRVTKETNERDAAPRLAATFFWRPAPWATLRVPPSPRLRVPAQLKQMRFDTWCRRVAKRYEAHRKRGAKKPPSERAAVSAENENGENGATTKRRGKKSVEENARENGREGSAAVAHAFPAISRSPDSRDTRLALLGGPLAGREKYLGGALGFDGMIYAIPGFARRVLRIDPSTGAVEYVGPDFSNAPFKWLRSVQCPRTGAIYGLPCHHDAVLKIVPSRVVGPDGTFGAPAVSLVGLGACGTGEWKYHGGVLSPDDGCFYCIPQFAERVLKIDPRTDACELIGASFPGRNKWYGGLLGSDDRIYGVPQNASGVLRIDPRNAANPCEVFGSFPEGGWKWHGGTVGPQGEIYGIPAHADSVLKIVPGDVPALSEIGPKLRTGKHRTDGKYKFLGGVLGKDDCVYFIPSDSDRVVRVECATETVREVGASLEHEKIVQNKWQNGFIGEDGVIWGIPLKAETVLTIVPGARPGDDPEVRTVGGPFGGLNKWEGGVMSACGKMYCMPLNHKRVLEIDPVRGVDGGGAAAARERRRSASKDAPPAEARAKHAGMNHD